jgi:hypothetical protein
LTDPDDNVHARLIDRTQVALALIITIAAIVSVFVLEKPNDMLNNALFLIIGFYFRSRAK